MSLPKIDTSNTSPNQGARNGPPQFIVLHHWGSRGQKFANVVAWLCNPRSKVSAHYVAEGGRVARLVDESRRAWHAGSNNGNHYGIGIECRPEATEADYATVAALVADIRRRRGDLPLRPHSAFTDTACPGVWDLAKLDRLARGSKPAAPAPAPVKPATPPAFPLPRRPGAMCYYGPANGGITSVSGKTRNSLAPDDVVLEGRRWRSRGLATWQRRMNARGYSLEVDGRYGPATRRAALNLQRLAGLTQDGKIGPETYAAAWTEPVH